LDEPIPEDELADWSHDIDLFTKGLSNPDKLEALWEQSKAKNLWDDSQSKSPTQLDQHLSESRPEGDSISIEDYMNRWCNVVQTPSSPTPQEDHRMPQTSSSEKLNKLDNYNKFINELSVRVEGGWHPADHIPHDEDLLRHTLGFPTRVKQDRKVYLPSDIKRNQLAPQADSGKRIESDKKSTSSVTTKGDRQSVNQRRQQLSEDEELLFQLGLPLKEDNINSKIRSNNCEIFMVFLSDATNRKSDSTTLEDLDYDEFLSEPEITEAAAASHEIPPPGITVTVHLDNNPKMILKTEHQQQLGNSFDCFNNDLHNVIDIGHNARIVFINKREDHEEVESYSPTSNYQIPDIYGYNSRKRCRDKAAHPSQPKQSTTDSAHQKIHSKCFLHPKGKHSSFQCSTLRKALGAPPISANKDNKKEQYNLPTRNSACQLLKRVIYWAYPRSYTQ